MSVRSNSEAMDAVFERRQHDLEELERQLAPEPNESGAVFTIDGRVVGLELFGATRTWRRFARKIIRSYGLDALDKGVQPANQSVDAGQWLQELAMAHTTEFPSIGLGQDVRIGEPRFSGGALLYGQTLIHLAAFDATAWQ